MEEVISSPTKGLFVKFKESGKQIIIYGIGFSLRQGAVFLLTPIYTHRLSTIQYGLLSLSIVFSSLVGQFARSGIEQAVFRSYYDYDDPKHQRVVIGTAIFLNLVLSILVIGIMWIFLAPISRLLLKSQDNVFILQMAFAAAFFQNLTYVPLSVIRLRMQPIRYSVASLAIFILQLVLTLYWVIGKNLGIRGVLLANLTAAFFAAAVMLFLIRDSFSLRISRLEIRKLLSFGVPYAPAGILSKLLDGDDRYVMQFFGLTTMVGIYTLGYNLGQVVQLVWMTPLGLMLTPIMFVMEKHTRAKEFFANFFTYCWAIGTGLALLVAMVSKEVVQIIAKPEYKQAWIVTPILSLAFAVISMQSPASIGITLKRKTQYFPLILIVVVLINLLLNYFLIPAWGMVAAAMAELVAAIIWTGLSMAVSQRFYNIQYQWRRLIQIFGTGILVYALSYFIPINNAWISIVFRIILWLLFPVSLIAIGFLTNSEKAQLGKILSTLKIKVAL